MVTIARWLEELVGREIMRVGAVMRRSQDAVIALFDVLEDPACARCRDGVLATIVATMRRIREERTASGQPLVN